jgi:hypothetical protein
VLAEGDFQLYPNPASEYIDFLFSGNNGGILKIYSITGTLVDQKVLPNKAQSYRYDLNVLKKGYYFVMLSTDTKTNVVKFLKD